MLYSPICRREGRASLYIEYNRIMTKTSKASRITDGLSMVRHIPAIEMTKLVNYELEMFGLSDEEVNTDLLQTQSHTHPERGTICIAVVLAELRQIGPFMLPFPVDIVQAHQNWDSSTEGGGGGSRLNPRIYP